MNIYVNTSEGIGLIRNILKIVIYLLPVFILCNNTMADQKYHKQAKLHETDRVYKLLEQLFISSGEVNPALDYLFTWGDAMEIYDYWKERHPEPDEYQSMLIRKIDSMFGLITDKGQIKIALGVDYLHHSIPDCTESNKFYQYFRDKDFNVKYEHRERFVDAQLRLPLHRNLFLSTRTSLRNDWKYFNARQNDFPRNLKEFNINVNERSILHAHFSKIRLIFGRDRLSLGVGRLGKLLISPDFPETNHFQFQFRYKDKLTINHIIASMKNQVLEEERPKILYAHRLTYRFLNRFALSITELQVTNQSLNAAYINPFVAFHNLYDYPEQRNSLTALDAEVTPIKGLKTYASFVVDEIDVSSLEEGGDKGREAWGLLTGLTWVRPLQIDHATLTAEYIKLTEWLYNHGFPWEDFYSLNYVFEERQGLRDPDQFHRFAGHHLGANAEALLANIRWQDLELHIRWIQQGEIPIFSRAFSRQVNPQKEKRLTMGLHYNAWFWKDIIELKTSAFYSTSNHFHQYQNLSADYLEFWLSIKFNILNYQWDMAGF